MERNRPPSRGPSAPAPIDDTAPCNKGLSAFAVQVTARSCATSYVGCREERGLCCTRSHPREVERAGAVAATPDLEGLTFDLWADSHRPAPLPLPLPAALRSMFNDPLTSGLGSAGAGRSSTGGRCPLPPRPANAPHPASRCCYHIRACTSRSLPARQPRDCGGTVWSRIAIPPWRSSTQQPGHPLPPLCAWRGSSSRGGRPGQGSRRRPRPTPPPPVSRQQCHCMNQLLSRPDASRLATPSTAPCNKVRCFSRTRVTHGAEPEVTWTAKQIGRCSSDASPAPLRGH